MITKFILVLLALVGIDVSLYLGLEVQPVTNRIEESHSSFIWTSGWESLKEANASGGALKVSGTSGSKASVSFVGTGIILHYATSFQGGMAIIELDGKPYTYIDMYSAIPQNNAKKTIASGLENTWHTLSITVADTKNPSSSDSYVVVDALEIQP